jgi:4,5-dihydroxyphthalate decarboxylase
MRPQQAFAKMLQTDEFDIAEMSFSQYAGLVGEGNKRLVAIPVMLSKMFRHDCLYVRDGAGIEKPEDLKGKRVGTIRYASTGIVFIKGFLQHDHGILARDLHWFIGGLEEGLDAERPANTPDDVRITLMNKSQTLEGMLVAGELDAMLTLYLPPSFIRGDRHIRRLFPDFKRTEIDYYRRTGIFPIMHVVTIRREVHEKNPWIAQSLYRAFSQARDIAVHGLHDTDALHLTLPFLIEHVEEAFRVFGRDYFSYGLEPNRRTVEALCQYLQEQGLTQRRVAPEELFLPVA